ncbi:CoA transferase (plasmid) [Mycolicibacterium madagascariense]|uniref:CoA transferase n=1 Tax=Mycolicibacterium madagascariense TaxID=212765 RepID=A0A7I7XPS6_9MYCO|nr:CoA transferase [Mycolicibacterium madagascariense]BBZ31220.1 CoA transferase [Mycolicibacterium madagascariense]
MTSEATNPGSGSLAGVRVVEIGDHQGEYCGLVLAGLGAEVVKIEPPGGSATRMTAPFVDDIPDPDQSLHFWAYNRGKRSIVVDLETDAGKSEFASILQTADVLLDSTPVEFLAGHGFVDDDLRAADPRLIVARITPFGETGPYRDFAASDLVHLALGGIVMNNGYDPDPKLRYDTPPIAPQLGHSFAIAGEQMAFTVIAALSTRNRTGRGQRLSCAIHEAVAKNTEGDLMSWVALRTPFNRQTCRHSAPTVSRHRSIFNSKDGRWYLAMTRNAALLGPFLGEWGIGGRISDGSDEVEKDSRVLPGMEGGAASNMDVVEQTMRRYLYEDVPWREAQEAGLMWVPVRKPHENAHDEHWLRRGSYTDVEHPEIGQTLRYPTSKWITNGADTTGGTRWLKGRRAPLLDEDRATVLATTTRSAPVHPLHLPAVGAEKLTPFGSPFPLQGVRILDFTWMLASAGATRFLAALGADVIKVEWHKNLDPRRGGAPVGGREAREAATGPVPSRWPADQGGPVGAQYNNKNPGKRGISLNVKHPKGLELARRMVAESSLVTEGFSPGVMEAWGLGYDVLRDINPTIIYAKQSGMGSKGIYGRFRTVGPVAQAFSGLSEMSGLAEPFPPAGWGYSYLDWYGAYSFALALLAAIYHRETTGEGQWIDASQSEVGLYLTAVPLLDYQVNGRVYQRAGNRSPYSQAAPEGIYRCLGEDRWIAITCRNDHEWALLAKVAGHPEWLERTEFSTQEARGAHRVELDALVQSWTQRCEPFTLMHRLQEAGIAAGVAQTAQDRVEYDPQLRQLDWLTELDATNFGRWPVAAPSVKLSDTPQYAGGPVGRAAAAYGEHNHEVYHEVLGLSADEVDALADEGVI